MGDKVKFETVMKKEDLVEKLREIASQVEAGYIMVGDNKIELPEEFEFEIKFKYDEEKKKKEIEFEIEWKE